MRGRDGRGCVTAFEGQKAEVRAARECFGTEVGVVVSGLGSSEREVWGLSGLMGRDEGALRRGRA